MTPLLRPVGTKTLSTRPLARRPAISRATVERLTPSSRAVSRRSGLTRPVAGSTRRRNDASILSPKSNGSLDGRPRGLPVARCFDILVLSFDSMGLIIPPPGSHNSPLGVSKFPRQGLKIPPRGNVRRSTAACPRTVPFLSPFCPI